MGADPLHQLAGELPLINLSRMDPIVSVTAGPSGQAMLGVSGQISYTDRRRTVPVSGYRTASAAALIALPAAIMQPSVTLQAIGRQVYTAIPGNIIAVFRPAELLLLATSGLAIAAASALPTAS